MGEGDSVTVYSGVPLVGFAIKGGSFDGKYYTAAVLKATEFQKGVPVTFEFDKSNIPNPSIIPELFDNFHMRKELYLPSGEYAISATLNYSLEKNEPGKTITAELLLKVQKSGKLSAENTVILVAAGLALICIPSLLMMGKMRKQLHSWWHLNDYDPSREETFEEKLKKAKIQPQKVITFGQNRIAIDSMKKKLFVRSSKAIDGVLLDYKDIVSYELIKDDKVIARNGGGYIDSKAAAGEGGIICSDLRLVITTRKQSDPEVVLPFISFSIDSEFAYNEALDAAKEAAQEIEGIIG